MSASEIHQMRVRERYSSDYSRWELDVVDDPASQAEARERAELKDKQDAAEFEKNNPDFCNQFMEDQR